MAEASKPIPLGGGATGAFQCVEEKDGRTMEELEALGFSALKFEDKILRAFNEKEKKLLGVISIPDKAHTKLTKEKRRPYGTPKHCPLRISFGEQAAA